MKYIIILLDNLETPILFPPWMEHSAALGGYNKDLLVSAGKVSIDVVDGIISCFGKSVGLGVESRGEQDAKLIREILEFRDFL